MKRCFISLLLLLVGYVARMSRSRSRGARRKCSTTD